VRVNGGSSTKKSFEIGECLSSYKGNPSLLDSSCLIIKVTSAQSSVCQFVDIQVSTGNGGSITKEIV